MKRLLAFAAVFIITALASSHASAQMGNPFKYTVASGFMNGSPAVTYQSGGTPATAAVQLLDSASYTIQNTSNRTRTAEATYTIWVAATLNGASGFYLQGQASENYNNAIEANDVVPLALSGGSFGSLLVGQYTANGTADIYDNKTTDELNTLTPTVGFEVKL